MGEGEFHAEIEVYGRPDRLCLAAGRKRPVATIGQWPGSSDITDNLTDSTNCWDPTMKKRDHFEHLLRLRLSELEERLRQIDDDLDEPSPADTAERATETEDDEVLEALGLAGLEEYRKIQAALKRIEDDTFGECMTCGEQISDMRLEVIPYATQCRNCANAAS